LEIPSIVSPPASGFFGLLRSVPDAVDGKPKQDRTEPASEQCLLEKTHTYAVNVQWSAAGGEGTKSYRSYRRDHTIVVEGKPEILASSDPAFRGNPVRHNPEELLVASLSSCHMLWYLHLCATNGIVVLDYRDRATGTMREDSDGSGRFVGVELRPEVTVELGSDRARALELHEEAHRLCFIARSVNFPVDVAAAVAA
jgi:organic hydroperoxide reductase OsmC/OhrA